jgi:hypothetical protein
MIIVVAAAPNRDPGPRAREVSASRAFRIVADPTPALCRAWGFQTLYEMPPVLQSDARLEILRRHRAELDAGSAVFEQGVVAWLADWMRWHWSATTSEAWENVLAEARAIAARYDAIEHRDDAPLRGYDGHHWLDRRHAEQVERCMRVLYDELGLVRRVAFARAEAA